METAAIPAEVTSPSEHLRLLWGDDPPGWMQVWVLRTRGSAYLRNAADADGREGQHDVYTAVHVPAGPRPRAPLLRTSRRMRWPGCGSTST